VKPDLLVYNGKHLNDAKEVTPQGAFYNLFIIIDIYTQVKKKLLTEKAANVY